MNRNMTYGYGCRTRYSGNAKKGKRAKTENKVEGHGSTIEENDKVTPIYVKLRRGQRKTQLNC